MRRISAKVIVLFMSMTIISRFVCGCGDDVI